MRELLRLLSTDALVLLERRLRRIAPTFMLQVIVAIRWELLNRYFEADDRATRGIRRVPINTNTRGAA